MLHTNISSATSLAGVTPTTGTLAIGNGVNFVDLAGLGTVPSTLSHWIVPALSTDPAIFVVGVIDAGADLRFLLNATTTLATYVLHYSYIP